MTARARLFSIFLHAVVVLLPGAALLLHAPDAHLFGVEAAPSAPRFTLHDWLKEDTQKSMRTWFEAHLGLRGVMVKTDNTLLHESLGDTKPDSPVKVGREGTLFVDDDVWYASKRPQDLPPLADVRSLATLVADVQRRLETHGKHLVVILTPAKTSIYPEDVPARFQRRRPAAVAPGRVVYDAFRNALLEEGASFTDARALISTQPERRDVLFMPKARHWSRLGACRVLAAAATSLPGVLDVPTCAYAVLHLDPREQSDFDLYELRNVWRPFDGDVAVPVLDPQPPAARRPRALFVGSSFIWMLIDAARPLVRDPYCFYYNSTIYDVATPKPREVGKVDPADPRWLHYALDEDVYFLEILEAYLHGTMARAFLTALRDKLE